MTTPSRKQLNARKKIILEQERAWALSTALGLRKQKVFTVWEVLMPVLLIFNFARAKVGRENFVQNLLFTKSQALMAAARMVREGTAKEESLEPARKRTEELLTAVEGGIYSQAIRERQLEEMDLLADHYHNLLQADGKDFPGLIRCCFPRREGFESFLDNLKRAEARVSRASLETLGDKGDPAYAERIEGILDHYRRRTADKIFGPRDHA